MRPLKLFTVVWGDNHLGWFDRACLKSLQWPLNANAIRGSTWHIFTKRVDAERVKALIAATPLKLDVVISEIPDSIQGNSPQMGAILLQCLFKMIHHCLESGAQMLTCPPDTVFSEGSIQSMRHIGRYGHSCVALPHPRVSPSIFGQIKDQALSGAELVSLTMKHGHRAWSGAEIGHSEQNSFVGGIAWQKIGKIGENLLSVQHRLPTVYLSTFQGSDYTFFQKPHDGLAPTYGCWDHVWPSVLLNQERLRVIGSSDAAFVVEVTKDDLNVPPQTPINPYEPDGFWRSEHHNQILRQFCFIMRGEN